jgi:predicted Zn-dependent protease
VTHGGAQAWRFAVIVSDVVASFSTPGGYVFVTEGLLRQLDSEAELAAALAHEVAHVALGHQAAAAARSASAAPDQYGAPAPQAGVSDAMERIYVEGMDAADEFAADSQALRWLGRAGYSPGGMVALLRGYASADAYDVHYALLRQTHPAAQERLRRLELWLGAQDTRAGVVESGRYRAMRARL